MPKYEPSDEEMEEAYGAKTAPTASKATETEPESVDEQNAAASEIIVSKSDLPPDSKVGDSLTFRVVKDYGDESGLELVEGSEPEETTEEHMSTAGRELTALSEEGS